MSNFTRTWWFRTVAVALIISFVWLDVTWAYPADGTSSQYKLAVPDVFTDPVRAPAFQAQSGLLAATLDVANYVFGDTEHGIGMLPIDKLEAILTAPRGGMTSALRGIDLSKVVLLRETRNTIDKDTIRETEPTRQIILKDVSVDEDVLYIPYSKEGRAYLIQVAVKNTPACGRLLGNEVKGLSDKYVVKVMRKRLAGEEAPAAPAQKSGQRVSGLKKDTTEFVLGGVDLTARWHEIARGDVKDAEGNALSISNTVTVTDDVKGSDGKVTKKGNIENIRQVIPNVDVGDKIEFGLREDAMGEIVYYAKKVTKTGESEIVTDVTESNLGAYMVQYNGYRALRPANLPSKMGRQPDRKPHQINPQTGKMDCLFSCDNPTDPLSLLVRPALFEKEVNGRIWRAYHNASPFEKDGHFLLVPDINKAQQRRMQKVTREDIEDISSLCKDSRHVMVFFNSLHAGATVNHIHFQGVYHDKKFPVENEKREFIGSLSGANLYRISGYAATGLVLQGSRKILEEAVWSIVGKMQDENLLFNLIFVDGDVYIFPRNPEEEVTQEFPSGVMASYELAGKFIVTDKKIYEEQLSAEKLSVALTKTTLAWEALELLIKSIGARLENEAVRGGAAIETVTQKPVSSDEAAQKPGASSVTMSGSGNNTKLFIALFAAALSLGIAGRDPAYSQDVPGANITTVNSSAQNFKINDIRNLIESLKGKDEVSTVDIIITLEKIGLPAVQPLIEAMKKADIKSKAPLAMALAQIGEPAVLPLIKVLDEDNDPATRSYALMALADSDSAEALVAIMMALGDDDHNVANTAAALLVRKGKAVTPLLIALLEEAKNETFRANAAIILGEIGDEKAAQPLRNALKDKSAPVRETARKALEKMNISMADEQTSEDRDRAPRRSILSVFKDHAVAWGVTIALIILATAVEAYGRIVANSRLRLRMLRACVLRTPYIVRPIFLKPLVALLAEIKTKTSLDEIKEAVSKLKESEEKLVEFRKWLDKNGLSLDDINEDPDLMYQLKGLSSEDINKGQLELRRKARMKLGAVAKSRKSAVDNLRSGLDKFDTDAVKSLLSLISDIIPGKRSDVLVEAFKEMQYVEKIRRLISEPKGDWYEADQEKEKWADEGYYAALLEKFGAIGFRNASEARGRMVALLGEVAMNGLDYAVYVRQSAVTALRDIGGDDAKAMVEKAMQDPDMLCREVRIAKTCSEDEAIGRIVGGVYWILGKEKAQGQYPHIVETIKYLFAKNPEILEFLKKYPLRLFSINDKSKMDSIVLGDFRKYWFQAVGIIHLRYGGLGEGAGGWQEINRTIEIRSQDSPVDMGLGVELFGNNHLLAGVVYHEYQHYKGILSEGETLLRQVDFMKSIIAEDGLGMPKDEMEKCEKDLAATMGQMGISSLGYYFTAGIGDDYLETLNSSILKVYGPDNMTEPQIENATDEVIDSLCKWISRRNSQLEIERLSDPGKKLYELLSDENKVKIKNLVKKTRQIRNSLTSKEFSSIMADDIELLTKWDRYTAAGGGRIFAEVIDRQQMATDSNLDELTVLLDIIAKCGRIIEHDKNDAQVYIYRGDAYAKLGQFAYAIDDFTDAIRIEPKNAEAYFARGAAYALLGKAEDARKDWSEAVKLNSSLEEKVKEIAKALSVDFTMPAGAKPNSSSMHSIDPLSAGFGAAMLGGVWKTATESILAHPVIAALSAALIIGIAAGFMVWRKMSPLGYWARRFERLSERRQRQVRYDLSKGGINAYHELSEALFNKDLGEDFLVEVMHALRSIDSLRAIGPFIKVALDESMPNYLRRYAIGLLGEIGLPGTVKTLEDILTKQCPAMKDRRSAVSLKESIVKALGDMNDPAARECLVAALRDPVFSVREAAARALIECKWVPKTGEEKTLFDAVVAGMPAGRAGSSSTMKKLATAQKSSSDMAVKEKTFKSANQAEAPIIATPLPLASSQKGRIQQEFERTVAVWSLIDEHVKEFSGADEKTQVQSPAGDVSRRDTLADTKDAAQKAQESKGPGASSIMKKLATTLIVAFIPALAMASSYHREVQERNIVLVMFSLILVPILLFTLAYIKDLVETKREEKLKRESLLEEANSNNIKYWFDAACGTYDVARNIALTKIAGIRDISALKELLELQYNYRSDKAIAARNIAISRLLEMNTEESADLARQAIAGQRIFDRWLVPRDTANMLRSLCPTITLTGAIENMDTITKILEWYVDIDHAGPGIVSSSHDTYHLGALIEIAKDRNSIRRAIDVEIPFMEELDLEISIFARGTDRDHGRPDRSNMRSGARVINNPEEAQIALSILKGKMKAEEYDRDPSSGNTFDAAPKGPYTWTIGNLWDVASLLKNTGELRRLIDEELAKQGRTAEAKAPQAVADKASPAQSPVVAKPTTEQLISAGLSMADRHAPAHMDEAMAASRERALTSTTEVAAIMSGAKQELGRHTSISHLEAFEIVESSVPSQMKALRQALKQLKPLAESGVIDDVITKNISRAQKRFKLSDEQTRILRLALLWPGQGMDEEGEMPAPRKQTAMDPRVTELFEIVENTVNNERAKMVINGNALQQLMDKTGILPAGAGKDFLKKEMTAVEIKRKLECLLGGVEKADMARMGRETKAIKGLAAKIRKGMTQFEADSFSASVLARAIRIKRSNRDNNEHKKLYIGLAEDWMPNYDKSGGLESLAVYPIMDYMEKRLAADLRSVGLDGVVEVVVSKKSEDLPGELLKRAGQTGTDVSDIIALGRYEAVSSSAFDSLRSTTGKEGAVLAGIDAKELEAYVKGHESTSDDLVNIKIMEILSAVLEVASGKRPPDLPGYTYDNKLRMLVIVLPKIERIDYKALKDRSMAEAKALHSA